MAFPYWHGGSLLIKHARYPVLQRLKLPSRDFSHRYSILIGSVSAAHPTTHCKNHATMCHSTKHINTYHTGKDRCIRISSVDTSHRLASLHPGSRTHSSPTHLCCVVSQLRHQLCSKSNPEDIAHHLLIPKREPTADQSPDVPMSNLVK